jgi:hypothetical protein
MFSANATEMLLRNPFAIAFVETTLLFGRASFSIVQTQFTRYRKQCQIDSKLGCLLRSRGHPIFILEIVVNRLPRSLRKAGDFVHGTQ